MQIVMISKYELGPITLLIYCSLPIHLQSTNLKTVKTLKQRPKVKHQRVKHTKLLFLSLKISTNHRV